MFRQWFNGELADRAFSEGLMRQLLDNFGLAPDAAAGAEFNEVVREQA